MKMPKFDDGSRPLDISAWVVEAADAPWNFRDPMVKVRSVHFSLLAANQVKLKMQSEALRRLSDFPNPSFEVDNRYLVYRAGIMVRQARLVDE